LVDIDLDRQQSADIIHFLRPLNIATFTLVHRAPLAWQVARLFPWQGIVALSPRLAQGVEAAWRVASARVCVLPKPHPPGEWPAMALKRPSDWPFADTAAPVIATMGYLDALKGCEGLIQAMVQLKALGWECPLLVLGEGPARPMLARTAQALGIRACFPGAVANPDEWLSEAQIYVASQHGDTSGWDLEMAARLGLALVANKDILLESTVMGLADVIAEVRMTDILALTETIHALLNQPVLADTYRLRARSYFSKHATETWVSDWQKVFLENTC
jgi:glycosyltransferase involved in cell wall biosynthesis